VVKQLSSIISKYKLFFFIIEILNNVYLARDMQYFIAIIHYLTTKLLPDSPISEQSKFSAILFVTIILLHDVFPYSFSHRNPSSLRRKLNRSSLDCTDMQTKITFVNKIK
jgi:hypothetical protein